MRVSASMESLWQYIQSLSLSERNRIWLADKLLEGTRKEEEETEYISKEEILAGIDAGLKELKLKKEGKLHLISARDFLKELRDER
ncbi:surface protein [Bacteroides gallinaceum]|uniref:Surface protein n=1 Tax=Bacteroides gallinaceum TaxID=1462571 RepID=A0ABT7X2H0_9BACE|nr:MULTISPECIES: surface protein [Bacteroides]MDN0048283.1 surface protein [Bacteroides gallinaceum]OUO80865.1 surface protein [Bacteroides sp. An269]